MHRQSISKVRDADLVKFSTVN